ncbi:hypothetical protein Fullmetal_42 [Microbacterium phage Fullmetal]|uniref:Uncharacterized protein n=6 Tax=Akonivirus TaxID=2842540 RepID=A0A6M3TBW8_9CAUD|nr:hypothetical protein HWD33_gp42 [Microbacterium phage Phedro]QFG04965.1 hypothetical protein SEA_PHRIEDRICE_43 [Microbacterium phage PhriedRice]QJD52894.1 hypothetical protein SEA_PHRACTURED_42 [Microbacterium phage Phractured]QJD53004.1 hypothetical protein SEA_PHARKY_42 [Microbacterium phage Pharky]QWY82734.1 hypothetical protein SEA_STAGEPHRIGHT_42 [Microbacterium phage StagePhright]UXE04131.1 hypothetical protein Fullmetal_42 [Microbacterium phage Fullmetal]
MGLIDDLVRNFTGGGSSSTPKSSGALRKASASVSRPAPANRQPAQQQPKFTSVLSEQPTGRGGGGGGGRGMVGMSIGGGFKPTEKEDEPVNQDPMEMFLYGQNKQGREKTEEARNSKFNFWDDLGAYFTTPVEGSIFTSPGIAGAAQRKEDAENARTEAGLKPGDVPSNEQLKQLGQDDELVNVDGDLLPLNNSPQGNAQLIGQAAQVDKASARDEYADSLTTRNITVRELSDAEWAALTPEQQRSVLSTWALYQASLEDQELGASVADAEEGYADTVNSMFTNKGGSDTYAPNTVRTLQELGYTNENADLDQFLDRSALPSYEDILGQTSDRSAENRQATSAAFSGSSLFSSEGITTALAEGQSLIDALRVSGSVSDDFKRLTGVSGDYSSLTEDDFDSLNTLFNNLSNRDVLSRMSTDPELNARITSYIDEANAMYGPELVSRYFDDVAKTVNDPAYLTYDEFVQNWMEG